MDDIRRAIWSVLITSFVLTLVGLTITEIQEVWQQKVEAEQKRYLATIMVKEIARKLAEDVDPNTKTLRRPEPVVEIPLHGYIIYHLDDRDPWGFPLNAIYFNPARGVKVRSRGPDGIEHTNDDIEDLQEKTNETVGKRSSN